MAEPFTRETLQHIRERARDCAVDSRRYEWKQAYHDLVRAADRLDAMMARAELPSDDLAMVRKIHELNQTVAEQGKRIREMEDAALTLWRNAKDD